MLDLHNHLMPAVDDGAADLSDSRAALRTLSGQGVTKIITTPHIRGSVTNRPVNLERALQRLDEGWHQLAEMASVEFPDLQIERGAEVMLDTPSPDLSHPSLRLAGTSFVLIEFPFMSIPPHSTQAILTVSKAGWKPVIAHPERYSNMPSHYDLVEDWRDAGACIQVNSGSLLGYYGVMARRIAWHIVERGSADYLSSDYHARGKCAVKDSETELRARGGEAQHLLLTTTNPELILLDKLPIPVPPFIPAERPFWKKLVPWN